MQMPTNTKITGLIMYPIREQKLQQASLWTFFLAGISTIHTLPRQKKSIKRDLVHLLDFLQTQLLMEKLVSRDPITKFGGCYD